MIVSVLYLINSSFYTSYLFLAIAEDTIVDYDEDYDEVVDGWLECTMEKGFCVTSNGTDQNSGVKKLNALDGDTPEIQQQCLELCFAENGATGCEVIWSQNDRGCYVHTEEIARGNDVDKHECWIFSKCESTLILIISLP